MTGFRAMLHEQRWDDHRYYHHSLVNQSLHLLSATTFLCAYAIAFFDLGLASLLGWTVAMVSRQCGHFFFEPKGFDTVNNVSHEYKEAVKVGYNLERKWVFMTLWALSPLLLVLNPTLFGVFDEPVGKIDFLRHLGLMWFAIGAGGLAFRTVHLFFLRDVQTGLVWAAKIVTDPFNDVRLYHKAPLRLLAGERLDHVDGLVR